MYINSGLWNLKIMCFRDWSTLLISKMWFFKLCYFEKIISLNDDISSQCDSVCTVFHFADFFFRYSARALYRSHAKTLTCFVKMEYLKRCIVSYYPRLYDASKRRVKFSRESCSNLVRIYWIYVVLVISEIGAVSVLFIVAVIKINIEWWEIWLKYDEFSCRC